MNHFMGTNKARKLPCGRSQPSDHAKRTTSSSHESGWQSRLATHQKTAGLNHSEARTKIAQVIASQVTHFTAPEIVRLIQVEHPSIGTATVYRNLPVLVDAGIIQEGLSTQEGQSLYELAKADEHHDHVICLDCDAIFEFHDDRIEERQKKVLEDLRFRETRHRHVIYARCSMLKR